MANYVSVLKSHEKYLMEVLALLGIGTGVTLGAANAKKVSDALHQRNVPHDTHDDVADIGPGRVYK
jgi:hypothetical protein